MIQYSNARSLTSSEGRIQLEPIQKAELIYKNIQAIVQDYTDHPQSQTIANCYIIHNNKKYKKILNKCSGKFSPGTFTAIVGPSGCGKTTLMNILSGRNQTSNRFQVHGQLSINGESVVNMNQFREKIGYVSQEDILMATLTPKQSFQFIVNLRLGSKDSEYKKEVVQYVIEKLQLQKCQDTLVGNNLIKGISGGEKKRVAIGIELLINPSIIFLDQPTTGLDSATASNLIEHLKAMAKAGRTVIAVIHQPSSEIFAHFDQLTMMVAGNIIYNGESSKSIEYFASIGYQIPKNTNPMDQYLKLMNREGIQLKNFAMNIQYSQASIKKQFDSVLKNLKDRYNKIEQNYTHTITQPLSKSKLSSVAWIWQFWYILIRNIKTQYRNPSGFLVKIIKIFFYSISLIIFYQKSTENFEQFDQNLKGLIFVIVMIVGFSGVFTSINTFSVERPVFLRQKMNNTYSLVPYFCAKIAAQMPVIIIHPFATISICYWVIPFENEADSFFLTILVVTLLEWMSHGYGFLLSSLIGDPVIANNLVSIFLLPLTLFSGYFRPLNQIFDLFRPLEYISAYKYGFQAMIQVQYRDGAEWTGLSNVTPNILSTDQYSFQEPFWVSLMLLFVLGLILSLIGLLVLWYLSKPNTIQLKKSLQLDKNETEKGLFINLKGNQPNF